MGAAVAQEGVVERTREWPDVFGVWCATYSCRYRWLQGLRMGSTQRMEVHSLSTARCAPRELVGKEGGVVAQVGTRQCKYKYGS